MQFPRSTVYITILRLCSALCSPPPLSTGSQTRSATLTLQSWLTSLTCGGRVCAKMMTSVDISCTSKINGLNINVVLHNSSVSLMSVPARSICKQGKSWNPYRSLIGCSSLQLSMALQVRLSTTAGIFWYSLHCSTDIWLSVTSKHICVNLVPLCPSLSLIRSLGLFCLDSVSPFKKSEIMNENEGPVRRFWFKIVVSNDLLPCSLTALHRSQKGTWGAVLLVSCITLFNLLFTRMPAQENSYMCLN